MYCLYFLAHDRLLISVFFPENNEDYLFNTKVQLDLGSLLGKSCCFSIYLFSCMWQFKKGVGLYVTRTVRGNGNELLNQLEELVMFMFYVEGTESIDGSSRLEL